MQFAIDRALFDHGRYSGDLSRKDSNREKLLRSKEFAVKIFVQFTDEVTKVRVDFQNTPGNRPNQNKLILSKPQNLRSLINIAPIEQSLDHAAARLVCRSGLLE